MHTQQRSGGSRGKPTLLGDLISWRPRVFPPSSSGKSSYIPEMDGSSITVASSRGKPPAHVPRMPSNQGICRAGKDQRGPASWLPAKCRLLRFAGKKPSRPLTAPDMGTSLPSGSQVLFPQQAAFYLSCMKHNLPVLDMTALALSNPILPVLGVLRGEHSLVHMTEEEGRASSGPRASGKHPT